MRLCLSPLSTSHILQINDTSAGSLSLCKVIDDLDESSKIAAGILVVVVVAPTLVRLRAVLPWAFEPASLPVLTRPCSMLAAQAVADHTSQSARADRRSGYSAHCVLLCECPAIHHPFWVSTE